MQTKHWQTQCPKTWIFGALSRAWEKWRPQPGRRDYGYSPVTPKNASRQRSTMWQWQQWQAYTTLNNPIWELYSVLQQRQTRSDRCIWHSGYPQNLEAKTNVTKLRRCATWWTASYEPSTWENMNSRAVRNPINDKILRTIKSLCGISSSLNREEYTQEVSTELLELVKNKAVTVQQ